MKTIKSDMMEKREKPVKVKRVSRVTHTRSTTTMMVCPACDNSVITKLYTDLKYCPVCGQRIEVEE